MTGAPPKLRVAVLGAGYFAAFHHEAWARMPQTELAAIGDLDLARAERAATAFGAASFGSLATMLEAAKPDLLDIAVPPAGHAAAVRTALAAGLRAIICQKPFCTGLAESQAVTADAEAAGATLVVHENFRFQPWHRAARAEILRGRIGTPYGATFRLRPGDGQGSDAYLARQPYFQAMPRFLLRETGIHLIDVLRFLLGEVAAVFADLRRLNPAIAGEDAGLLILRHAEGARSLFDGNRCADHLAEDRRRTMGEMWVEGSAGSLRLDGAGRLFLRVFGSNDETRVPIAESAAGFGGDSVFALQAHVVAHLLHGAPAENTARAYLANLRVEAAAYRSAEAGCWQCP